VNEGMKRVGDKQRGPAVRSTLDDLYVAVPLFGFLRHQKASTSKLRTGDEGAGPHQVAHNHFAALVQDTCRCVDRGRGLRKASLPPGGRAAGKSASVIYSKATSLADTAAARFRRDDICELAAELGGGLPSRD
jgi:hypothetical protein